jgi:hypothetical protein
MDVIASPFIALPLDAVGDVLGHPLANFLVEPTLIGLGLGRELRFRREARARERHHTTAADSLKVLDLKRPIREADIRRDRNYTESVTSRMQDLT